MLPSAIVAGTRRGIAECLIGLIDQRGAGFRFAVQGRCMSESIRVPDLQLLVPGLLDVFTGGRRRQFEHLIIREHATLLTDSSCRGV